MTPLLDDMIESSPNHFVFDSDVKKTYIIEKNNNTPMEKKNLDFESSLEITTTSGWHSPSSFFGNSTKYVPKFSMSTPCEGSFGQSLMAQSTPRLTIDFTKLNRNFSIDQNLTEPVELSFRSQKEFDQTFKSNAEELEVKLMDLEVFELLRQRRRGAIKNLEKCKEVIGAIREAISELDHKTNKDLKKIIKISKKLNNI